MPAAALTLGFALCTTLGLAADPRSEPSPIAIFLVEGVKPERGEVWRTRELALAADANPPVLPQLEANLIRNHFIGTLAQLTTKELAALRAAAGGARYTTLPETARELATIRLRAGQRSAFVQLRRDDTGAIYAFSDPGEKAAVPQRGLRLAAGKIEPLVAAWPAYRGDFTTPVWAESGRATPVPQPLTPGVYSLDRARLSARFLRGEPTKLEGTSRRLADESFILRLPKNFDAKQPSGLVIWVHAASDAVVPEQLVPALDELNFVCIAAAKTGNARAAVDRYQLTLDALATASEHILIDAARVYTCGISGGAKISSSMWACFPDLFAGVVAIVGLSVYENVPSGDGRFYRADFSEPPAALLALLRTQHAAAITGPGDGNHTPITGAVRIYERDKIAMELFDIPALGHEMPTAKVITHAFRYTDEPARDRRERDLANAAALLTRARDEKDPDTRRDLLIKTMGSAPWSPAAWEAHALLETH